MRIRVDGSIEPFDELIIATGSRSHVPLIEGVTLADGTDKPGVFALRTLDDCREIAQHAKGSQGRAVIIGGGLLGLEAARGLQSCGLQVEVVHRGIHLMNQQLDPQAGTILKATMEQMNVGVLLGKNTTAVLGEDRVTGLRFADGSMLPCDMVVMAAGIKPNAEIGQRVGLRVQRAIVVDKD